jgi:hypothetical protein
MSKKMVLVEERIYDELWKRSPMDTMKSHLSNKLQSQLNSNEVGDDEKVKQYQKTLNRFLNLKQQVPNLQASLLNGTFEESKKKRKPVRTSQRRRIKWTRHNE